MSQEWINNPFHMPQKGVRADELKILWEHFKLQNESKRIIWRNNELIWELRMWGKVRKRSKLFSELWRLKIRTSLHNLARKKPTDSWTFTFSTFITTSSPFGTGSGSCSVQSRCTNISFPIELHQKNSMCGKTPYYPFNWMWYSTVIEDTGSNHCHKLTLHNIARPCKTMQCYVRSFQVTWEVADTSKVGCMTAKSYYLG